MCSSDQVNFSKRKSSHLQGLEKPEYAKDSQELIMNILVSLMIENLRSTSYVFVKTFVNENGTIEL